MYEVSSEIYKETNFQPKKSETTAGKVVSKFRFSYPKEVDENGEDCPQSAIKDKDGDFLVCRRKPSIGYVELEHSEATVLKLVGLQVWRGALLLADFFFHRRNEFRDAVLLELGAGVGLTSIAAALYARRVICTDVDIGGILKLIRGNVQRNRNLSSHINVKVLEYDFMQEPTDYSVELKKAICDSDVVFAADVIYDDELTDAFVRVLDCVFKSEHQSGKKKQVFIALEKRFVFTLDECDAVAPMFEYFLRQTMKKSWRFEYIPLDFPQYFEYERCKQLILLKVTSC